MLLKALNQCLNLGRTIYKEADWVLKVALRPADKVWVQIFEFNFFDFFFRLVNLCNLMCFEYWL